MSDDPDHIQLLDATTAMRRPLVWSDLGGGKKLPRHLRPTVSQASVLMGGIVGGLMAWAYVGAPLAGHWVSGTLASMVIIFGSFGAAMGVRLLRVDHRSAARFLRAFVTHRARTRGRDSGPWVVHGRPVPQ